MTISRTQFTAADSTSDSAALLELSTTLNASTSDLNFILGIVLLSTMGKLLLPRSAIFVEKGEQLYCLRAVKGIHNFEPQQQFEVPVQWKQIHTVTSLLEAADPLVRDFARSCADRSLDIVVPMLLEKRMVGILTFSNRITGKPFDAAELTFLESVAAVAATAVRSAMIIEELRMVNRQLDKKVQEMHTLFELSREMNNTLETNAILRIFGYALMGQLRVLRYIVYCWDGTNLRPFVIRMPGFPAHEDRSNELLTLRTTVQFTPQRHPENSIEQWLATYGVQCIVPMISQNEVRGMLCLGDRGGGGAFDADEIEYLNALTRMTVSELENTRMFSESLEKQRIEKELTLARSIQQGLLPKSLPSIPGYDLAAINESSLEVGGDYYDIIPLSDHEFVLAIADVAGKGIPAALLMANLQAALRTIAPLRLPLPEATARINNLVYNNTDIDTFITFFWGVLNVQTHRFVYVNAGHNPPCLLRTDDSIEKLSEGGLILGVLHTPPSYTIGETDFRNGDLLLAYTDGVSEAMSAERVEFGDKRLLDLVLRLRYLKADELIAGIRDEILLYTRDAPQSDDITLFVNKRIR